MPGHNVTHGAANPYRRAVFWPGNAHQAAKGLGHHVVGRFGGVFGQGIVTKAGYGGVDDVGFEDFYVFIGKA